MRQDRVARGHHCQIAAADQREHRQQQPRVYSKSTKDRAPHIRDRKQLALLAPSEGGASSASGSNNVVPYEQRLECTIGNLGWDDIPEVIEKRAKEVLVACRMVPEDFEGPVAVRYKGSLAEVRFTEASKGSLARLRCKALRKVYVNGKMVWLDAKKTQEELRPGTTLRRICEILALLEQHKSPSFSCTSNLRDMTVSANEIVMVNLRVRPPVFSKEGIARYSVEERRQVIDSCEN